MIRRDFFRSCIAGAAGMIAVPKLTQGWYRQGRGLPLRDDTAYLQGLIDRGLSIPAGDWVCRGTLVLRRTGFRMIGSHFVSTANPILDARPLSSAKMISGFVDSSMPQCHGNTLICDGYTGEERNQIGMLIRMSNVAQTGE